MILPFSHQINGKQTFFAEKILKMYSLNEYDAGNTIDFWELSELNKNDKSQYKNYINYPAKLHTIRTDEKNRWKSGNKIHCVYHNRSKKQFQFCPTFHCKSVQKIEIVHNSVNLHGQTAIYIDDKLISCEIQNQLIINDGFETIEDFSNWFKSDFVGKIIHFTDLHY